MGEFDEFITGKIELEIGGKQLLLDAKMKDKRKILAALGDGEKNMTEDKLEKLDGAFMNILTTSYPNENVEGLEGFYDLNRADFMTGFFEKIGWAKKEEVDKFKKENPN